MGARETLRLARPPEWSVMGVSNVHGPDLAWALVEVAKPHLSALERNYTFVALGAGDTFAAVHQLLKIIAAKRIPLQSRLVLLCRTWLATYAGHEEYEYLRGIVEGFASAAPRRTVQSVVHTNRVTQIRPGRRQPTWAPLRGPAASMPPPVRREIVR
ncbi:hypothetical protein [Mycobacterium sp. DBP42]|uniref:hypothetical protein n=1 Tax=Mycobacterium sp. DBP42 TaxID=2545267 RepID=UPI00110CEDC2|nr:hypothetical protein [Mycobacterium sp. DBP42]TMS53369.1 hypothetical protein E0T84_12290 [Mycobacterium sp. DBP42]